MELGDPSREESVSGVSWCLLLFIDPQEDDAGDPDSCAGLRAPRLHTRFLLIKFHGQLPQSGDTAGGGEGGGRRVTAAAGREAGKRTNATTVRSSPQREALSRGGMHRLGIQIEGADDRSP